MDPITQGIVGAAAPQALAPREHTVTAGILGMLAGMSPDLDVFIRSSSDPLLFLEYHRQFTHSLFFIPFGGMLCGLLLYWLFARKRGISLAQTTLYCTLGYATHAILDACTSYGTMLFWPFSQMRVAWNTVSVIDPLFTVPIILIIGIGTLRRSPRFARLALVWALAYPSVGLLQRDRAAQAGLNLAAERGHQPVRFEVKPSFGNLLLWKVVYEAGDRYHVDAIRVGFSAIQVYPGTSVAKLDIGRDLPWLLPGTQQARDIERFRRFSSDFIAKDPAHDFRVIDIRYSTVPNRANGLWGIELSPAATAQQHVLYRVSRDASEEATDRFKSMLWGE